MNTPTFVQMLKAARTLEAHSKAMGGNIAGASFSKLELPDSGTVIVVAEGRAAELLRKWFAGTGPSTPHASLSINERGEIIP